MKRLIAAGRSVLGYNRLAKYIRVRRLKTLLSEGLPSEFGKVAAFLLDPTTDRNGLTVSAQVEKRRADIVAMDSIKSEVPILYSPKPGSESCDASDLGKIRPNPGETAMFSYAKIANTGKDWRWGTALYILAREFKATNAIELGACAGLSAMYLASASSMEQLVTVEGSSVLANLATESLAPYHNATVHSGLFDDALDVYLPAMTGKLDFAYIDGHHEQVATLHYFQRMLPHLAQGAIVVFDDIRWSSDMHECWNKLGCHSAFDCSVDLGAIGVCRLATTDSAVGGKDVRWDLSGLLGKRSIGNPHGWE